MDEADYITITKKSRFGILVVISVASVGIEEPVVVGILVVVASNLLLV